MGEAEERQIMADTLADVATPEALEGLADGTRPISDAISEDYVIINFKEWPIAGPYEGHEGYRRWARDTFEPIEEGYFEESEPPLRVGPGVWVIRISARGRLKETGMELAYEFASVQVIRDGKIVLAHGFLDFDEAMAEARKQAALAEERA